MRYGRVKRTEPGIRELASGRRAGMNPCAGCSYPSQRIRSRLVPSLADRGIVMDEALSKWRPAVLSLFRSITGLMLFQYGVVKILKIPAASSLAEVEITSLFGIAGCIELVIGGLLLVGLFTRLAAFI